MTTGLQVLLQQKKKHKRHWPSCARTNYVSSWSAAYVKNYATPKKNLTMARWKERKKLLKFSWVSTALIVDRSFYFINLTLQLVPLSLINNFLLFFAVARDSRNQVDGNDDESADRRKKRFERGRL